MKEVAQWALGSGETAPIGGEVVPQIGTVVRIRPELCSVSPLNPRALANFDPAANKELLESIRAQGQQVPVILRPAKVDGRYELVAGTRRFGAVRFLQLNNPDLRLLAEVRDLSDQGAWVLAEVENASRKDLSELEQAKSWDYALRTLFEGNQSAMARAVEVDKSVVSRKIALARLPEQIVSLVTRPEHLRVRFAEQLVPKLNDPDEGPTILAQATALLEAGQKFSPADLVRHLLYGPQAADSMKPQKLGKDRYEGLAIWQTKENGSAQLLLKKIPDDLGAGDKKALIACIAAQIKIQIEGR